MTDLGRAGESDSSRRLLASAAWRCDPLRREMSDITIRLEAEGDERGVRDVLTAVFETPLEADLAEALRRSPAPTVSLVAADAGRIVGHILFSQVTVESNPEDRVVWGLGPMGVLPARQRRGIGLLLVRRGLDVCHLQGIEAVVVLGHAEYYPRFGFVPAGPRGLHFKDAEFDPYFMVRELRSGALACLSGFVEYSPEFDQA